MTILTLAPKLSLPYAQDWNLNVQKSFGADWLAKSDTSAPRERISPASSKATRPYSFPD